MKPLSQLVAEKLAWNKLAHKRLVEAAQLGLSFAPKGPVPEGLDPTFYHTLHYASEVKLQQIIDEARAFVVEQSPPSIIDELVPELVEALEMGAFHHNSCPWLDGRECCCANSKVKIALSKLRKALGENGA